MRSSQLSLDQYDTDKISNNYLEAYDPFLEPLVEKEMALLELGVYHGGSLLLWRDYFPSGTIVGIDVKLPTLSQSSERIHLFEGSQADPNFLSRVSNKIAPDGFDVIIDDATHIGQLSKIAFWHLFENHLKPGGLYVIEDWGTGYWSDWHDGKSLDLEKYLRPGLIRHLFRLRIVSRFWFEIARVVRWRRPLKNHSHGMVGFIKQLIDEQGAEDATRGSQFGEPGRGSRFESITIIPSIVFVRKAQIRSGELSPQSFPAL